MVPFQRCSWPNRDNEFNQPCAIERIGRKPSMLNMENPASSLNRTGLDPVTQGAIKPTRRQIMLAGRLISRHTAEE
jgi:hypothetical protein